MLFDANHDAWFKKRNLRSKVWRDFGRIISMNEFVIHPWKPSTPILHNINFLFIVASSIQFDTNSVSFGCSIQLLPRLPPPDESFALACPIVKPRPWASCFSSVSAAARLMFHTQKLTENPPIPKFPWWEKDRKCSNASIEAGGVPILGQLQQTQGLSFFPDLLASEPATKIYGKGTAVFTILHVGPPKKW